MRYVIYSILEFYDNQPLRFIILFVLAILSSALIIYLFYIWRTKNYSSSDGDFENFTPEEQRIRSRLFYKLYRTTKFLVRRNKILLGIIVLQSLLIVTLVIQTLFLSDPVNSMAENPSISSSEYIFGIDISHYNGEVDWPEMRTSHHPIEFVFIRATMGKDGRDKHFIRNWIFAKHHEYIRGAYHYYRPNEDWYEQFQNYAANVKIEQGDFVPILDVEKESKRGKKFLREGVLNWLKMAEKTYGVKPMIYTGVKFYLNNLQGYVDEYPLWIAAYSGKHKLRYVDWTFHQFTEQVRVKGIKSTVDGNDFNGDLEALRKMCKP